MNIATFGSICDEKVMNIDVVCMATTECMAVFLQQDGTLIVLIYHVVDDSESLGLQKIPCPNDQRHSIVNAYQFSFGQALGC